MSKLIATVSIVIQLVAAAITITDKLVSVLPKLMDLALAEQAAVRLALHL